MFRLAALSRYSSLPTDFNGPLVFRERFLLAHHHFVTPADVHIYSFWSGGVLTELGIYFQEVIVATVMQLSIWTGAPLLLIHQVILSLAMICLSLVLLLRGLRGQVATVHVAAVTLFVMLGSPTVILYLTGWDSAYGWVLFLVMTSVALSSLSIRWKVMLTLILTVMGPPIYHTFGFYLTLYTILLWTIAWLFGYRRIVASPMAVLVCYLTYEIYVSTLFFHELAAGIKDVLSLGFLHRERRDVVIAAVHAGPIDLHYVNITLYVLTAVPVAITMLEALRYLRGRWRRAGSWHFLVRAKEIVPSQEPLYLAATVAAALSVGAFGIMFGAKFGIEQMMNRGAEYMTLPALLSIINELRYHRQRRFYLYPLLGTILVISCYSFLVQSATAYTSTRMTLPEEHGYVWLAARLRPEDTVFTEFRLSGPFIANGHFRVVGITGQGYTGGQHKENTQYLLRNIYYGSSPHSITAAIDTLRTYDGRRATYLFLSTQMMKTYPGITGYDEHFRPASPKLFSTLAQSADWRLTFANEQIRIYRRALHSSGRTQAVGVSDRVFLWDALGEAAPPTHPKIPQGIALSINSACRVCLDACHYTEIGQSRDVPPLMSLNSPHSRLDKVVCGQVAL